MRDEEQFFYKFFSQKKMLAKFSGEEETTDKKKKSKDDLEFAGETDKETGKNGLSLSLLAVWACVLWASADTQSY